ncbi:DUF2382 domain-containing protein [Aliterella atlantica]|uniref:DUF2382 domain-containing protein n=1 Tax=Aliterella atlantica TaxID=1827278 RepID=UPI0026B2DAAC
MMAMGEDMALNQSPEMMAMGDETDMFNTPEIPEMMAMGDENTELFNTPELSGEINEANLFDAPEMMAMGEDMALNQSPEMVGETSENNLFETPEIMAIVDDIDSTQTLETIAQVEENQLESFDAPEVLAEIDNENLSQTVEEIPEAGDIDLNQTPETTGGINAMELDLGVGAIAAAAASIPLLEERLIVDRNKEKVGEVVVRKEIETEIVEVPIRREKLIVEQVGAETKQLASIDLGQTEIPGVELVTSNTATAQTQKIVSRGNEIVVEGEFSSAKIASLLLNAIALERRQGCKKIRLEIIVDDNERQQTYQEWVDRCSVKPSR